MGLVSLEVCHFHCSVEGENLSNKGELIPSRKANVERRIVNFKNQNLLEQGYSYLLIYIAPVDSQVSSFIEIFLLCYNTFLLYIYIKYCNKNSLFQIF